MIGDGSGRPRDSGMRYSRRVMNGVVMRQSLVVNEPMSEEHISEEAIREELSRILESSIFVQSDRLSRFLRYTVETTLAGDAETLKEYLIGTEVYDRRPPYHPNMDSIVRSEARRLRRKLKEYYESMGKNDLVLIYYRPGSYVPAFRRHDNQEGGGLATDRALRELLTEGLVAQALEIPSLTREVNLQIVFEGTVRILRPRVESSRPTDLRSGQNVRKRIQLRKVVGMPPRKIDQD